ncbi:MAG: hypothetical protein Q4P15_13030 [Propionibacteriaceae bacterium]|nr:hypothetical protein [Propionibacteriaceae bacterium]
MTQNQHRGALARTLTRGIAATAAILLLGSMIPAAQADPVEPPKPYISCPTNAKVDSILGGVTKSSTRQAHACSYVRDTGRVEFEFVADELAPARATWELGFDVVDVPELGPDAFALPVPRGTGFTTDMWYVGYLVRDEMVYLKLPATQKEKAVTLAKAFDASSALWSGPTVPAKPYTAVCPSAKAIGSVLKQTVKLQKVDGDDCNYAVGQSSLSFSIKKGFGSVAEHRIDLEVGLKTFSVRTYDFGGMGEGAYAFSDASPTFMQWQMCDGVVAGVVAWEDNDVVRRLAQTFAKAQNCSNAGRPSTPKPSKPGLPSTGN